MSEKKINIDISKVITGGVLAVIIAVLGYLFNITAALSARVDQMSAEYTIIQTQLSQIQTDLVWIKKNIK